MDLNQSELRELPVNAIETGENIREVTEVDEGLMASIQTQGIIEPLIVRPNHATRRFELVAGFRRFEAAVAVGLETVPCRVMDLTDQQVDEIRLVENLQRQDLSHLEQAKAIRALIDKYGYTQEEVGRRIGMAQPTVANRLRLLELPESVQESIRRGILSGSAAGELLKLRAAPEVLEAVMTDLARKNGEDSPPTVAETRGAVTRAVYTKGRHLNRTLADLSGCRGCKAKITVYGQDYCADPPCLLGKEARYAAAQRAAAALDFARVRAGEDVVLDWNIAPRVLETCPADCPDRGMARRTTYAAPEPVCLRPDSECREERLAEFEAARQRRYEELRQQEEAARRAREEERQTYLRRVELYLAHRVASKQSGFSRPEMRLVSLAILSEWGGSHWLGDVLGWEGSDQELAERLLEMSTRELTTLALAFVLGHAEVGEPIGQLARAIVGMEEVPEPEEGGADIDIGRLFRAEDDPEADDDCDGDCDNCDRDECPELPEPADMGEDGTYESYEAIQPAGTGEGEGDTPEASEEALAIPKCDRGGNCRACGVPTCNMRDEPPDDPDCSGVCEECSNTDCANHPGYPGEEPHEAAQAEERVAEEAEPTYTCPYTRQPVNAWSCQACNDMVRAGGTGCCEYVIAGDAPHTCARCVDRPGCAVAERQGVA